MKNKERRSIFTIALIVLVLVILGIVCYVLVIPKNNKSNINDNNSSEEMVSIPGEDYVEYDGDKKINVSEYMESEIYLDDFTFSNFYIYSIDNLTQIEFDVSNDSSKRKGLGEYVMKIYSETEKVGEVVCTGEEFAAGQTKRLSLVINADVANLLNIELESMYTTSF